MWAFKVMQKSGEISDRKVIEKRANKNLLLMKRDHGERRGREEKERKERVTDVEMRIKIDKIFGEQS